MHPNHGGEVQEGYGVTKNCKTRENSIFLRKGKTVILVNNPNFSRSQMTKLILSLKSSCEI